MQKTVVRIMALLLVALMCLTLLPINSWAYDVDPAECVDHVFDEENINTVNALKSAATCTTRAVYYKTCSKCGTAASSDEYTFEYGEALDHSFGDWGGNTATCLAGGIETRTCTRCPATETRETTALGHDYSVHHDAVAATCTTDGSTEYYSCSRCQEPDPDSPMSTVPATGHKWVVNPSPDYVKKAATCTEKASYYQSCEKCGAKSDSMYFDYGEPLGHDWKEHTRVEPTCADAGTEAYKECDRCHIKDPENAPVSINATGNHSWKPVVDENYLKSAATCTAKAQYYQSCEICGAKSPDRYFETGEPLGHTWVNGVCNVCNTACEHTFDENDECTICHIHRYSFTVTLGSNGSATWNGNAVTSGAAVKVLEGTSVEIVITPADGYQVDALSVTGGSTVTGSNTVAFTMNTANNGLTVSCTFKQGTAGKTPVAVVTKGSIPDSGAVNTVIANLAAGRKLSASQIMTFGYDVTPYWNGNTSDPVASSDITSALSFVIPYPTGLAVKDYDFIVYHYDAATDSLTELPSVKGSSGVVSSSAVFSPVVLLAAPKGLPEVIVAKEPRVAPAVTGLWSINDARVDKDAFARRGRIMGSTTEMLYRRSDQSTYQKVTEADMPVVPGTYYVKYPENRTHKESLPTEVFVGNYYTVLADHLYGKGWYSTNREDSKYPGYGNVYLVPEGTKISFSFTPDTNYWLHEINVNGHYVGAANVSRDFTTSPVTKRTVVSFGFSPYTSSPKTADNSMVLYWSVIAVGTFIGMTTITWYLFRKKED